MEKKSDYYTSAEGYTDLDGLSRRFTFIDHDPKTSIGASKPLKEEEKEALKAQLQKDKEELIGRILQIPAVFSATPHHHFTLRGETNPTVEWNAGMLYDPGVPINTLRDIYTLASNKKSLRDRGIAI